MADAHVCFRPRDTSELEIVVRWLADRIHVAGVRPASCEGDLAEHIIRSFPGVPVLRECDQRYLIVIEILSPRDMYDEILARWTRPTLPSRDWLRVSGEIATALPQVVEIVVSEFEKNGYLSWNAYERWRRETVGANTESNPWP